MTNEQPDDLDEQTKKSLTDVISEACDHVIDAQAVIDGETKHKTMDGTEAVSYEDKTLPEHAKIIRVSLRDGSVDEFKVSNEAFVGTDNGIFHVYRYTGLRATRQLIIAYPLGFVRSWQIIRPDEQLLFIRHPNPRTRRIVKFSGLAGEVPVGTIVEWRGDDDVPAGWREVGEQE